MRRTSFILFFLLLASVYCSAQQRIRFILSDSSGGEPVQGVSIRIPGVELRTVTNTEGKAYPLLPNGAWQVYFYAVGYQTKIISLTIPSADTVITVQLKGAEKEMQEVVISSLRTDSRIENTATRVEVLGLEETTEEAGIKPAQVASLLGDVSGIQAQQTSAVTGNMDLRIQGLRGDYSQLLQNGMPLFGGLSGSFSILQVPPLDLQQIEIIKGASSTLYGGGAIAGLINFIPKKPVIGKRERSIVLNQSTLRETNLHMFLSDRDGKIGYTFFTGGTYQHQVDVNEDGFSDVPSLENIFFHPVFFFYPTARTSFSVGLNNTYEQRKGGDMQVLRDRLSPLHQFSIQNQSLRNTLDIVADHKLNFVDKLSLKLRLSNFKRDISSNVFGMKAKQLSLFSEISYLKKLPKHNLVAGINLNGDRFSKRAPDSAAIPAYRYFTVGAFIQDDWTIQPKLVAETGMRLDYHNTYGAFALPRISLLYKFSSQFSFRAGAGMGYRVPTVFNGDVDERDYRIVQLDSAAVAEKSWGVNTDFNLHTRIGEVKLQLNQSVFLTRINRPLVPFTPSGVLYYYSARKPVITRGFETWVQLNWNKLETYLGYTFTDAQRKYDTVQSRVVLTARDKFATVIGYAITDNFRVIAEASWTGQQYLDNGRRSPSWWFMAAMLRYDFSHFSLVFNCENIFDFRQSRKGPIINPPYTNPRFDQVWGPLEGRVFNLSVKLSW